MRTRDRMIVACTLAGATVLTLASCKGKEAERTDTAAMAPMAAPATDTAAAAAAAATPAKMTDANIAAVLDAANESDSAFGALAVKKGTSADVKSFGRLMMGEHHALRAEGRQLVKKLNVTPQAPANFDLPDKQRSAMTDLSGKSGADFDKSYIDHEVAYHQQVLETAQKALGDAQNADLKNLIQRAAPVIQKHLDRAKEIQKKLGTAA